MAIGLLGVYYKNTRENVVDVLVIRYIEELGMDCLELAVHCECEKFVSSPTVQRILTNIWNGKKNNHLKMV